MAPLYLNTCPRCGRRASTTYREEGRGGERRGGLGEEGRGGERRGRVGGGKGEREEREVNTDIRTYIQSTHVQYICTYIRMHKFSAIHIFMDVQDVRTYLHAYIRTYIW